MPFEITPRPSAPAAADGRMGRYMQIRQGGVDVGDDRAAVLDVQAPPLPAVVLADHHVVARLTLQELGASGAAQAETETPTLEAAAQDGLTFLQLTGTVDDRPLVQPSLGLGAALPAALPVIQPIAVGESRAVASLPDGTDATWTEVLHALGPESIWTVTSLDPDIADMLDIVGSPYGPAVHVFQARDTETISIAQADLPARAARTVRTVRFKFKIESSATFNDDAASIGLIDAAGNALLSFSPKRETAMDSLRRMSLFVGPPPNIGILFGSELPDSVWHQFELAIEPGTGAWQVTVTNLSNPATVYTTSGAIAGALAAVAKIQVAADRVQAPLLSASTIPSFFTDFRLTEAGFVHNLDLIAPAKPGWRVWTIEDGRVNGPAAGEAVFHVGPTAAEGWRFRAQWAAWSGADYPAVTVTRLPDVGTVRRGYLIASRGWGSTRNVVTIRMR